MTMTPDDAQARVDHIRDVAGDDEDAHYEQDQLFRDALAAIASESSDEWAQQLAKVVLQVTDIEFSRWYA